MRGAAPVRWRANGRRERSRCWGEISSFERIRKVLSLLPMACRTQTVPTSFSRRLAIFDHFCPGNSPFRPGNGSSVPWNGRSVERNESVWPRNDASVLRNRRFGTRNGAAAPWNGPSVPWNGWFVPRHRRAVPGNRSPVPSGFSGILPVLSLFWPFSTISRTRESRCGGARSGQLPKSLLAFATFAPSREFRCFTIRNSKFAIRNS
jgi:hypothetical protein